MPASVIKLGMNNQIEDEIELIEEKTKDYGLLTTSITFYHIKHFTLDLTKANKISLRINLISSQVIEIRSKKCGFQNGDVFEY